MRSITARPSLFNWTLHALLAAVAIILWFAAPVCADDSEPAPNSHRVGPHEIQPPKALPLSKEGDEESPGSARPVPTPADEPREAADKPAAETETADSSEESADGTSHGLISVKRKLGSDENAPNKSAASESGIPANAPANEPNVFATAFDDIPPQPGVNIDPASFNGVQPGSTTAEQLNQQWGEGKLSAASNSEMVRSYKLDSFPRIDVTLAGETIKSIVIQLQKPQPPEAVARQLQITDVRPVNIPDEFGAPLGQAYPERGVLLTFVPGGKQVSHVTLEKIDLDSFVLRAEMNLDSQCHRSLADLDYVLSQQPQHARALWLRAKLLSSMARYDEALAACEAAIEADSSQPLFHLLRGKILGRMGKYDQAAQQTKEVAESSDLAPDLKAKALCQLGDLIGDSPAHDYKLAMDQHLAAIKIADTLSADKHASTRRAAKLVLVDANLGLANDIACGMFQQKEKVVPQWLDKARSVAEDLIANESGDPALRLHVARGALAACIAMQGKIDSVPWARKALQQGKQLIAQADDPWRKRRLEWELGLALSDGLASDEFRGATQHALENSTLTVTYLEEGAKGRRENPEDVFRLGWMYYRVGAIYAVRRNDHKTAITWYEKALPLLDRPIPATQHAQQGNYGEWLVSMGITYWELGRRDEALQLTDAGMQHVEEAVNQKLIEPQSLSVPYNNLSAMHQALGHSSDARNFAEMAAKYDKTASKQPTTLQR